MKVIRKAYDWMGSKVGSPHADLWLVFLFFIESSFFIIPVDPLLILYCIAHARRALYYATLATGASVLGGLFGYAIGAVMWKSVGAVLVKWLISEHTFAHLVSNYKQYEYWVVLLGAFTPIPYKAITISAGFCGISLFPFVFCSIIGRGARFFLVAGAIRLWGPGIKTFIDVYFNQLVIAFSIILVLSIKTLIGW